MNTRQSTLGLNLPPSRHAHDTDLFAPRPVRACLSLAAVALLAATLVTTPAQAQYIRFRAGQLRVTVPANNVTGDSILITNLVSLNGLDTTGAALSVSGLPAGASATLSAYTATASGEVDMTVNATNIPEGVYTFSLNGSGLGTNSLPVTNNIFLTLQAGFIWNGLSNAAVNGAGNWSDSTKWLGSAAANIPGPSDDVIFTDVGGQTNAFVNSASYSYLVNCLVTDDTTIGSLRFAQTNSATKAHVIRIADGKTLALTGTNGLTLLRNYVPSPGSNPSMSVGFIGTNATLLISNATASVALLGDNSAPSSAAFDKMNALELTGLGRFYVDVNRIGLGDYQLYPNFNNLSSNNAYNGVPKNWAALLNLARTNVVRACYVDPNDFTNSVRRDYSLTLGNNERSGTSSNPQYTLNLGITNAFLADSICFGHASLSSLVQFPGIFANNYSCSVVFQGTNGGRMSMWAASDSGQGDASMSSGSNAKGTVNLTGGTADALVDRFVLSRDRINSSGQNSQATVLLSRGTFDVNTAILGYQGEGNHTNASYCEGTLIITNTARFKVNDEMILGYTSADANDPTGNDTAGNNGTWGRIYLGPGGTLAANAISCGGATRTSLNQVNQFISLRDGAVLVLTNTLGAADARLNLLALTNGSALTLNISGTGTKVFVQNLATSGVGANANVINVASVSGISSFPAHPVTIPILSYANPSTAAFSVGSMPPGVYGSVVNNTLASTIDLILSTNLAQTLVWRGTVSGIWDTTTPNWVTQADTNAAVWVDGDFAVFDDTATGPTAITISSDVLPGQRPGTAGILVSNVSQNYSFTGPGAIRGSATMQKTGSGTLTLDATTENSVVLSQGTLAGSGTIGSTVAQGGANLTAFAGAINGGLDVSNAAVSISGSVTGPLVLRAGAMTNGGTITGTASLQPGTYLDNVSTMNVTVPWSVPTNATLVNNGVIVQTGPAGGNNGLTIDPGGALVGVGKITTPGTIALADARVTINGNLVIGNRPNEVTNVTIATRLDLNGGSTTTFDVDLSNTNDTILLTDGFITGKVNFGKNNSLGGTLVMNRLGAVPFTAGTVLHFFDLTLNSPDNTVPAKPGVIPPPGPGLVWDISNMLTNLTLAVTGPPVLGTTMTASNITFAWPDLYKGWRLAVQTNALTVGLSTNWVTVPGSFAVNQVVVPLVTNAATNPAVFYQLQYP